MVYVGKFSSLISRRKNHLLNTSEVLGGPFPTKSQISYEERKPSNSKAILNISKAVITLLANLFYNTSATPLSTAYKYISIYTLGCLCSDITVHIHNCRALDVLPRISWNIMRLRGCGCLFTKCAGSTGSIYTPKSAHKTSDIYEEDTGCKELFN